MSESDLTGAMAAVLSHLQMRDTAARSIQEIHDFWNEWPMCHAPQELTVAALRQLEIEGEVERIAGVGIELWRKTG